MKWFNESIKWFGKWFHLPHIKWPKFPNSKWPKLLKASIGLPMSWVKGKGQAFLSSQSWQIFIESWQHQNREGGQIDRKEAELQFLPAVIELEERPVSPTGRLVGRVIISALLIGLLWAAFAPRPIHIVMDGKTIPPAKVQVIEPLEAATVKEVHVRNGNHVQEGDVLLRLDPTEIAADRIRLQQEMLTAKLDVARLQLTLTALDTGNIPPEDIFYTKTAALVEVDNGTQQREIERQWGFLLSAVAASRAREAALASDELRLREQITKLRQLLDEQKQSLHTAEEKFKVMDNLNTNSKGVISHQEFLSSRQEFERARAEWVNLQGSLKEAEEGLRGIAEKQNENRETTRETTHRQLAEAQSRLRVSEQELVKADRRDQRSRLRAPVSGYVANLQVHTVGEVVQTGERIMIIVPDNAEMEIEALLKNKDRGDVWAGQPVRVKIAAYPFTRYGVIEGEIMHISPDAIEVEGRGLMFPVQVKLNRQTMHVRGKQVKLGAGMAVTVEANAGSRTVLQYLITPLARIADEAMRER